MRPCCRVTCRRGSGFSLIVVFLLMLLMLGVGSLVLLATRSDLQVAGFDRESSATFYAAEAGSAFAKEWLLARAVGSGAGAWNAVLQSGQSQLCVAVGGNRPGIVPAVSNPPLVYDAPREISYQYCIHNNALDRNYFNTPSTGDLNDSDGIITIESYGSGPGGARSHVTVDIKTTQTGGGSVQEYFQAGGDSRKQATGEAGNVQSGSHTF